MKKISLTSTILWVMAVLIILSIGMSLLSIANLIYSLGDAKAINASGMLRMQSYQLLFHSASTDDISNKIISDIEKNLNSKELNAPFSWIASKKLVQEYNNVKNKWALLKANIKHKNKPNYLSSLKEFTNNIDLLIKEMEQHAVFKLKILAIIQILSLGFMTLIAWVTVQFTKKKVVFPLTQMIESANKVSKGNFSINIPDSDCIELSSLGHALFETSQKLSVLYKNLECQVQEKNTALSNAHNKLQFLHETLLILHTQPVNNNIFKKVISNLHKFQELQHVRLVIESENSETKVITADTLWPSDSSNSIKFELKFGINHLGYLEVISEERLKPSLFENFAMMLARSIFIKSSHQQKQKLALMEERGIIARELHDSLGQLLSFLKIQISLLKKTISKQNNHQEVDHLLNEIDSGVNDAYQQLRQLLSTFRLIIDEPNLKIAMQAMLDQLKSQTSIYISLDYQLPPKLLQANQHIHIIQLTREATLNAIKHANASKINICCKALSNGMLQVDIIDDGIGLAHIKEKQEHFGIGIMHERANKLAGIVKFNSNAEGGTTVSLSFPPLEIS